MARTMLWSLARSRLGFIDHTMLNRPAQAQLRAAAPTLLRPQLHMLGWTPKPDEDRQTAELRGDLISSLTAFGDTETAAQATWAFDEVDAGTRKLPSSLRAAMTQAACVGADRADFDRAEEWLKASVTGLVPANRGRAARVDRGRSSFGELAYRFALTSWKSLSHLAGTWGRSKVLPNAAVGYNEPARAETLLADQRRLVGAEGGSAAAAAAEGSRLRAAGRNRGAPALAKQRSD